MTTMLQVLLVVSLMGMMQLL